MSQSEIPPPPVLLTRPNGFRSRSSVASGSADGSAEAGQDADRGVHFSDMVGKTAGTAGSIVSTGQRSLMEEFLSPSQKPGASLSLSMMLAAKAAGLPGGGE